jgi:hypothetical protein
MSSIDLFVWLIIILSAVIAVSVTAGLVYQCNYNWNIKAWRIGAITLSLCGLSIVLVWVFVLLTGNLPPEMQIISAVIVLGLYLYKSYDILSKLRSEHAFFLVIVGTIVNVSMMYIAVIFINDYT